MAGDYIVVLVTVNSGEQARHISDLLVLRRLIACANIVGGVQSFFWWKGNVDCSAELLLIMKSRRELLDEITRLVRENHEYEVPEVVAMPIVGGNPDYLRWIDESVELHGRGNRP